MTEPVVAVESTDVFGKVQLEAADTFICVAMYSILKDKMPKDQINFLFNQIPMGLRTRIASALYAKTEELLRLGYPSVDDQTESASRYWKL